MNAVTSTFACALGACVIFACNTKKPDLEAIYDGPAEPEGFVELPAPKSHPVSDPVAGWRWVDLPDTVCRNGSSTGIAYQIPAGGADADKLVIFMRGGNACLNTGCVEQVNPSHFAESDWDALLCAQLTDCSPDDPDDPDAPDPASKWNNADDSWFGVVDGHPDNPFAGWTKVYVPYCSGDWYAGHNPEPTALGHGESVFMGTPNTRVVIAAIRDVLGTDYDKVLVTGASAGGIGAILNYHRFADLFGKDKTYLISDAGPFYPDAHVADCAQARVKNLWRMDRGAPLLEGCPGDDCVWNADAWMSGRWTWLLDNYARGAADGPGVTGSRVALVVSDKDSASVGVLDMAKNNCKKIDDIYVPLFPPYSALEAATTALREEIFDAYQGVKIFAVDDKEHMWMWRKRWWDLSFTSPEPGAPEVSLADWVAAMLDEDPAWDHVYDVTLAPASAQASSSPSVVEAIIEEAEYTGP